MYAGEYVANKLKYNILDVSKKQICNELQFGGKDGHKRFKSKSSNGHMRSKSKSSNGHNMTDKEIEWRWIDIDPVEIRNKLRDNNAELVHAKTIMPLMVFYHPLGNKDSYIRIRSEGDHITLTSKTNLKDKYVTEYEIIIDSFPQGVKILTSLGCKKKYYVEKLREVWKLPGCKEIVIDSYPGSREYMEIDCYDLESLKKIAELLGLQEPSMPMKGINDIYLIDYGIVKNRDMDDNFTCANGYEVLGKYIKKNKTMFKKYLGEQQKYYDTLSFDINELEEFM